MQYFTLRLTISREPRAKWVGDREEGKEGGGWAPFPFPLFRALFLPRPPPFPLPLLRLLRRLIPTNLLLIARKGAPS